MKAKAKVIILMSITASALLFIQAYRPTNDVDGLDRINSVSISKTKRNDSIVSSARLSNGPQNSAESLATPSAINEITDLEFESIPKTISMSELTSIKNIILSPNETDQRRQAHVYFLSKLGLVAENSLTEVVKAELPKFNNTHNPHSVDAYREKFEISIRITALEALDLLSIENTNIKNQIEKIIKHQKNPSLNFLANISLSGIHSDRPGKLNRFVDTMLKENGSI